MAKKHSINERVCDECKQIIPIIRGNYDNIIYLDGKCYHKDCFIPMCERKSQKKRALPKWKYALEHLDEVILNTKNVLDYFFDKNDVYEFIVSFYGLSIVTSKIFIKLDAIYEGTFKGMYTPIPPCDLYDMWVRQKKYLIKVKENNLRKGINLSPEEQVIYDLSILINKYDSYVRWKEQQKIIAQTNETESKILADINLHSSISNTNINKHNNTENDEDDINALLDELFD